MRFFSGALTAVLALSSAPLLAAALSAPEIVKELAALDNVTSIIKQNAERAGSFKGDSWQDALIGLGTLSLNFKRSAVKIKKSAIFDGSEALDIFGAYFEISEDSQNMLKIVEGRFEDFGGIDHTQNIVFDALELYKKACKLFRVAVVTRFVPDSFESQETIETSKDWRDAIDQAIVTWKPKKSRPGEGDDDDNGDGEEILVTQSHRRTRGRKLRCPV
ncbi:hypothetical protein TWF694_009282 [Orbilia ellipsospora]|uniref:Uncharacterized protein n=1 Tax=Orbilia ellipsospora TaxID=2528407 RepID=A0AAV9XFW0_9PEZI